MKIYHTETQEDYDALMVELEAKGYTWGGTTSKPTQWNGWSHNKENTCIRTLPEDKELVTMHKVHYVTGYPQTPITKYKAKVDDKMKFTKENVYKVFSQYRKDSNFPFNDLQDEIIKLDDTPKKAVVPKCFDEWFKEIKVKYPSPDSAKLFAMRKLCQKGFGYSFERADGKEIHFRSKLGTWLNENTFLAIDAVLNGYTIEPEQLYYIPLPHLETSDGIQQVLSQRKGDKNYFACRPAETLKQRYTKEEIAQVPEIYKFYATLIEEEEE